jgi:ADP-ribosyl-[dinitrogen reductase] hydrolase
MNLPDKIRSSINAAIVGDALGVPVEHSERQELALCAVKNMLGYGRYDEPKGTWSDDTSMILCTMECLCAGYDLEQLGKLFCEWLFENRWTATGHTFDSGLTTFLALDTIRTDHTSAAESGCDGEDDNGNGSLMRILPVALYFSRLDPPAFLDRIHAVSAITHAHPRSKIGCGIYALFIRKLLNEPDKTEAFRQAIHEASEYYTSAERFRGEASHFSRIFSLTLPALAREEISSSGYVVHTLEAAVWCFLHHENTRDVLLEAVNLGLDTDTTGTVAGGLAGLHYGIDSLPAEWINGLARKSEIDELTDRFCRAVIDRPGQDA